MSEKKDRTIERVEGLRDYLIELSKTDKDPQILEDIETLNRNLKVLRGEIEFRKRD